MTRIVNALQAGNDAAVDDFPLALYSELHRVALSRMAGESPGHTLQPTALVHEAWVRLFHRGAGAPFANRTHFFSSAAEVMRRILVEAARRKLRLKRGGEAERVDIDNVEISAGERSDDLLAVDEALEQLTKFHPRAAEVVKLCYFVGLTQSDAAQVLGISVATVERLWSFARVWLFREIRKAKGIVSDAGDS